jgi:hypothetical protein
LTSWTTPVVESVILPAHAQTSLGAGGGGRPCTPVQIALENLPPDSHGRAIGWEHSADAGATYAPYFRRVDQVIGPTGTQRMRLIWEFPEAGEFVLAVSGDKYDGRDLVGGQFYLDGALIAPDTGASRDPFPVTMDISAGIHTIEWWHGTATRSGASDPRFNWLSGTAIVCAEDVPDDT